MDGKSFYKLIKPAENILKPMEVQYAFYISQIIGESAGMKWSDSGRVARSRLLS